MDVKYLFSLRITLRGSYDKVMKCQICAAF